MILGWRWVMYMAVYNYQHLVKSRSQRKEHHKNTIQKIVLKQCMHMPFCVLLQKTKIQQYFLQKKRRKKYIKTNQTSVSKLVFQQKNRQTKMSNTDEKMFRQCMHMPFCVNKKKAFQKQSGKQKGSKNSVRQLSHKIQDILFIDFLYIRKTIKSLNRKESKQIEKKTRIFKKWANTEQKTHQTNNKTKRMNKHTFI